MGNTNTIKEMEELRELAYRAYSNTSFYPERRRDQVIKDYTEELLADLDLQLKKLDKLMSANEIIKAANKVISAGNRKGLTVDQIIDNLKEKELDTTPVVEAEIIYSKHCGTISKCRTLGPDIKRSKERVEALKVRIERKSTWEDITFEGGYITLEDDRIKICHDEKPEQEVINSLKRSGFRWSRHWGCWTRKHTGNAVRDAKRICCQ